MNTPSADDPIFVAWAGTDKKPAVQGYDPGVGADLYTTNGEQTDYAYAAYGALAITPELGEGNQDSGFEFPDSEGEVQHEFTDQPRLRRRRGEVGGRPDNPVSPVNLKTQPFYLNTATVDPQKSFNPMSDFTFAHSFNGADQPVQVLAKRDLDNDGTGDDVTLNYSIDGEPTAGSDDRRVEGRRSVRRARRHVLPHRARTRDRAPKRATTWRSGSRGRARRATRSRSTSSRRTRTTC